MNCIVFSLSPLLSDGCESLYVPKGSPAECAACWEENNRELFTVNAEQPFHCEVDEDGFQRMREYLLDAAKTLTKGTGR